MKTKTGQRTLNLLVVVLLLLGTALTGITPAKAMDTPALNEAPNLQSAATKFALITDYGTGVTSTANMVKNWEPDFIVTAGDNNQSLDCDQNCYAGIVGGNFSEYLTTGSQRFWPVIGNHDTYSPTANYLSYFDYIPNNSNGTKHYYDFVQGPVHFFMLDSEVSNKETQKTWLEPKLRASTAAWQIVIFHQPAYTGGAYSPGNTAMRWDFAEWGADFVIAGHNHIYERIHRTEAGKEIVYFTAGVSGGQTRTSSATPEGRQAYVSGTGAMRVNATNSSITFEYFLTNSPSSPADTQTYTRDVQSAYDWVAYNDCNVTGTPTNPANTTGIVCYTNNTNGELKNFNTGTPLGVNAVVNTSGSVATQTGTVAGTIPNEGTDAHTLFNGNANIIGGVLMSTSASTVTLTISGLSQTKSYTFATTANRGDSGSTYLGRITGFSLSDVDSAINASSTGTVIDGWTTEFVTGYNTVNGYIAKWENIKPGADGDFVVTFSNEGTESSAYGPAVFFLAQEGEPLPTHELTVGNDGNGTVDLSPVGGVYTEGTTVTLLPLPNAGFAFSHWSGDDANDVVSSGGKYTIVMGADKSITANFVEAICLNVSLETTADTHMRSGYSRGDYNFGGSPLFRLNPYYQQGSDDGQLTGALLRWDELGSTIPPEAAVNSASITFNVTDGSDNAYNLYNMRRSWIEGSNNGATGTGASWNYYGAGTGSWTTAGAENTSSDRFNTNLWDADASDFTQTGEVTLALNQDGLNVIQCWLNGTTANYGLTIQNYNGTAVDVWEAASRENTNYDGPTLNITYCIPNLLNITKEVDKTEASPGETLTYTISDISYEGTDLLSEVTVTDEIPSGTTYVTGSADPTAALANDVLTWTLGSNTASVPGEVTEGGGASEVTVLNASNSTGDIYQSTFTLSHTPGVGNNRLMVVGISWANNSTSHTISSVKFGNLPMTSIGTITNGSQRNIAIYYLKEPFTTSADTLSVEFSGETSAVIGAVTFAGVDQTNPYGTFVSASGSGTAVTVDAATVAGDVVFDTVEAWSGSSSNITLSIGTNQTTQWNQRGGNSQRYMRGAASTETATGTTTTMSWTRSNTGNWAIGAVPIKPAAGGSTRTTTLTASPSLVSAGDTITVEATFTNTAANNNITPTTLQVNGAAGASCTSLVGPTLVSADNNISGISDPVVYRWACEASAGTSLPGSLTFSTTATGEGDVNYVIGTSNSVLVAPDLTFKVTVDAGTTGEVENTASLNSTSFESKESEAVVTEISALVEITGFSPITPLQAGSEGSALDLAGVQALLPATATATYASGTVQVPVASWTNTDGYDPTNAGSYTFTAVLGTLPDGYANSGGFTATIEVVVSAPEIRSLTMAVNPTGAGTTDPSVGSHSYSVGTVVNISATAATGYEFDKWSGDVANANVSSTTVTMDTAKTVTANFIPKTFVVSFVANGGTPTPAPINVTFGSAYGTLPTVTRTGYTFAGWFTADTGGTEVKANTTVSITSDQILYAQWTANKYTVTFNANGGTTPVPATKEVTYGTVYGDLASTSRTGYTFSGWFTAASGGTEVKADSTVSITSDQILYAQWTANKFTVTFNANGGTTPVPASKEVTFDALYGELALTSRNGYTFNGWFTAASGGNEIKADSTVSITTTQTLYAQWTAIPYTLTIGIDPTSTGTVGKSPNQSTYVYNDVVTLTPQPAAGFEFEKWDGADAGDVVNTGGVYTIVMTANKNITAKFKALPSFTVTFNGNGATAGSMAAQTANVLTKLTKNTFTRTGFVFTGWNTDAGGNGIAYADEANYDFKEDLELYAQWSVQPSVVYELVTTIEADETYLVVARLSGGDYAMNSTVYSGGEDLRSTAVTIEGDFVTSPVDSTMLWDFVTGQEPGTFRVYNDPAGYIRRGSSGDGLILYEDPELTYTDWNPDTTTHNLYNISTQGTNLIFYLTTDTSGGTTYFTHEYDVAANNIYFYKQKLVVPEPGIVITAVTISGIDAPVAEATPDIEAAVAATPAAGITGTTAVVTWSPTDSPFDYATVYTASVILTATEGHEFTEDTTATVNGQTATSVTLNANGTLTVTYTFPITGDAPLTEIEAVAITGIDVPAAGGNPDTTANVAATPTAGITNATAAVTWSPTDNPFDYNTIYTASVTLTAATGYKFTAGTTATVNGETATVILNENGTLTVTYAFPKTGIAPLTTITAVAISDIVAPVALATPDDEAVVAATPTAGITGTTADVTWDPDVSNFNYATVYTASVTFMAAEGFEFTDDTTATVNGQTATTVTLNEDGTLTVTYTFPKTGDAPLTTITTVTISDIVVPIALATPDDEAVVTATPTAGITNTPAAVTWTPNDAPFKYATVYTASVTLTAAAGYEFTAGTAATVNGLTATTVTLNEDGTLTVTYTFPATEAESYGFTIFLPLILR